MNVVHSLLSRAETSAAAMLARALLLAFVVVAAMPARAAANSQNTRIEIYEGTGRLWLLRSRGRIVGWSKPKRRRRKKKKKEKKKRKKKERKKRKKGRKEMTRQRQGAKKRLRCAAEHACKPWPRAFGKCCIVHTTYKVTLFRRGRVLGHVAYAPERASCLQSWIRRVRLQATDRPFWRRRHGP